MPSLIREYTVDLFLPPQAEPSYSQEDIPTFGDIHGNALKLLHLLALVRLIEIKPEAWYQILFCYYLEMQKTYQVALQNFVSMGNMIQNPKEYCFARKQMEVFYLSQFKLLDYEIEEEYKLLFYTHAPVSWVLLCQFAAELFHFNRKEGLTNIFTVLL